MLRVRVWLGEHVIVDHVTAPELAGDYAEAMERRYGSCRVTNEALPDLEENPSPLGRDGVC